MSDFINKVITIILIFVMLILSPLLISYTSNDMVSQRLILNEVSQFIDRVTDKGEITAHDLDDLYMGINSQGGLYNVQVDRYIIATIESNANDLSFDRRLSTYFRDNRDIDKLYEAEGNTAPLEIGDVVKVHVEEIGMSNGKKLLWSLLRVDKGQFKFSLAGTVR